MKIHEYQAKQLMAARGIAIPVGKAAATTEEAAAAVRPIIETTGITVVVVKSQIHAGGRGKGTFREHPDLRGVVVVKEPDVESAEHAVRALARRMLGSTLVTIQTGPEGKQVNTVYIEQGIDIADELYLAVLLDRARSRNIVMASTEGGMNIEVVAAETPDQIIQQEIDPAIGLADFQANALAWDLGLSGETHREAVVLMKSLSQTAIELDTDLIEINPLVITAAGRVMALDAKMSFDNNALFRHPDVEAMADPTEEDPTEREAADHDLSYVKMDGSIGCMVNGAGLAMSTMDIIKFYGGEPANFLDVGGGATAEKVTAAFKIITKDPNVEGIFVNIFGGIMRCDTIASGVVQAVKEVGLSVPLVVRLEGTNVDVGKQILAESGLNVVTASDMKDGAKKIVEMTGAPIGSKR